MKITDLVKLKYALEQPVPIGVIVGIAEHSSLVKVMLPGGVGNKNFFVWLGPEELEVIEEEEWR